MQRRLRYFSAWSRPYPTTNSFGMSNPTYFTGTDIFAASGLRSSVQISTDAGPRDLRLATSHESVRPGVDDVLDDQHVPAGDVGVEVLHDADDAGRLGARAIGGVRHPVHLDVPGERAGEVGHHHDGTLEDAHEEQVLPVVVLLDCRGEFAYLGLDLVFGEEDSLQVVVDLVGVHQFSAGLVRAR